MKFTDRIDEYFTDQQAAGRINSPTTERSYRGRLQTLADHVGNRDPRTVGRTDIKTLLANWPHPNTQRNVRAIYVSFFRWMMEEGYRKDNPAEQTRRPKQRPTSVYRLTLSECVALMDASLDTQRERWAVHLGLLAGLRNRELRGLQPRHLARPGWIWVSPDIGKGGKERFIPILPELEAIVAEIHQDRTGDEYILCSRQTINPPANTKWRIDKHRPLSGRGLHQMLGELGEKAGIAAHVHPHLMRHAFGDYIARTASLASVSGPKIAQALLGHSDISTTVDTYTGELTLDDLETAVLGIRFRPGPGPLETATQGYPQPEHPATPHKATTGIEPVDSAPDAGKRHPERSRTRADHRHGTPRRPV